MDRPNAGAQNRRLSERFEDALIYATRLHAGQIRKVDGVPYIAHLLGVTALVLANGGDEDEAIAALLHDAVEDQGGLETLAEVRQRFGERVATIVEALTDAYTVPKPPWRERKEQYIERMRSASPEVRRVSLADKLHNARNLLAVLHREGEATWAHFNGGKAGTLWYYRSLADLFLAEKTDYLALELARVVDRIEEQANQG